MGRPNIRNTWEPLPEHRRVRDSVADMFGVPAERLPAATRIKDVVYVRQVACWVLRQVFPWLSYPLIGIVMGGRDHSTVIHSIRKIEKRRAAQPAFAALTDAVAASIGQSLQAGSKGRLPERARMAALVAKYHAPAPPSPSSPASSPASSPSTTPVRRSTPTDRMRGRIKVRQVSRRNCFGEAEMACTDARFAAVSSAMLGSDDLAAAIQRAGGWPRHMLGRAEQPA